MYVKFKIIYSGKTEDWKINDMNEQLKVKFHIDQDLDGVFIDSWAKKFPNDVSQQEAFTRETSKLWEFFSSKNQFEFKSIQDILDELHKCQGETHDAIEELKKEMDDRKVEIGILQDHDYEKDGKIKDIENKHDQDINDLSIEVATDINEVKTNISDVKDFLSDRIHYLSIKISNLTIVPIGSIQAWSPIPEIGTKNPVSIPNCWAPCDGSLIKNGIWKGQHTPDLNNVNRYLQIWYTY